MSIKFKHHPEKECNIFMIKKNLQVRRRSGSVRKGARQRPLSSPIELCMFKIGEELCSIDRGSLAKTISASLDSLLNAKQKLDAETEDKSTDEKENEPAANKEGVRHKFTIGT